MISGSRYKPVGSRDLSRKPQRVRNLSRRVGHRGLPPIECHSDASPKRLRIRFDSIVRLLNKREWRVGAKKIPVPCAVRQVSRALRRRARDAGVEYSAVDSRVSF